MTQDRTRQRMERDGNREREWAPTAFFGSETFPFLFISLTFGLISGLLIVFVIATAGLGGISGVSFPLGLHGFGDWRMEIEQCYEAWECHWDTEMGVYKGRFQEREGKVQGELN